jgi:hypothetical protein
MPLRQIHHAFLFDNAPNVAPIKAKIARFFVLK